MKEKRKFIRLKTPVGIVYKLIKKNKRQKLSHATLKDLSGGGACFTVKEDLRSGDLLDLEIQIPHLHEPVRATGEVVWFATIRDREHLTREAGIRFRDIEPAELNKILEYVHTVGIG